MTYTTSKGDTWDMIAYAVYGDESLIAPLFEANRAYIKTTVFDYGITLEVPELDKLDTNVFKPPWRE